MKPDATNLHLDYMSHTRTVVGCTMSRWNKNSPVRKCDQNAEDEMRLVDESVRLPGRTFLRKRRYFSG